MKRSTITLPAALADALDAYIGDQEVAPSTTAIVQVALEAFLSERGYLPGPTRKQLRLTPVDGGDADTSVKHDEILYGQPEPKT